MFIFFKIVFLRTDQGVHALKSSAHIDLDLPYLSHPNKIAFQINKFLSECKVPIKYVYDFIYYIILKHENKSLYYF